MAPVRSLKTGLITGSLLAGNAVYVPLISLSYLVVAGGAAGGR